MNPSSLRFRMAALAGVAVVSVAALAGCGGSANTTTAGSSAGGDTTLSTVTLANGATEEVSVYSPESGTAVNETLGQTFAIRLPQSPGTGYAWKAAGGTAVGARVELQGETEQTASDTPGAPGTKLFVYTASGEGNGTLVFKEFPPGSDTASSTVKFDVSVGAP